MIDFPDKSYFDIIFSDGGRKRIDVHSFTIEPNLDVVYVDDEGKEYKWHKSAIDCILWKCVYNGITYIPMCYVFSSSYIVSPMDVEEHKYEAN